MIASRAPTARAAMAMPSTTAKGRVSMRTRFVACAGSASYPLATTYRTGSAAPATARHLVPAG